MAKHDYVYRATVKHIVDGDTIIVDLDLGFHVWLRNESIRLENLWAPEVQTEDGIKAMSIVCMLIPIGSTVVVQTRKSQPRSFTRWVGTLFTEDEVNLNEKIANAFTLNAIGPGGVGFHG